MIIILRNKWISRTKVLVNWFLCCCFFFTPKVRWKDIEQKREQDKQRAIGFIVGQTDWRNLIDEPRDHSNALTAVKYIEKVRKK